jgi:serine/threonine protein kinase
MPRTINGRQFQWQLLEQIGKGDAGEVLRVQAQPGSLTALMKRPVQNASGGTILRQAVQIENEGQILASLNGLDASRNGLLVHTPLLLDQSIPGTTRTASLFIVSEEVSGVAISNLLKQRLQEDVSLSHVLVLRVLSGLFLLLERVHERGIAWNDVKMEHIFWDEANGKLSFIDWGNGLFLNALAFSNGKDPAWLDYQQFISEGNLLLNQIAPELIAELDWPPSATDITKEDLTQLQLRTEYLLSSLSMRVIDYQVLFRKQVRSIHNVDELGALLELKNSLESLGVPVEKDASLQAIQQLAIGYAQNKDFTALEGLLALIRQHLPAELGDVWKIAEFLLALKDARQNPIFAELLILVLSADWAGALWLLEGIRERANNPTRLSALQTQMRNAAGVPNAYITPIYHQLIPLQDEAHLQLIHRHAKNNHSDALTAELERFSAQLDALLAGWQQLGPGEMLGDKLLTLRGLLRSPAISLLPLPRELPKALSLLLTKLREFFAAWSDGDLEACRHILQELFLLEPSMPYLQQLDAGICAFQSWVEKLSNGPEPGQTLTRFAEELLSAKPTIAASLSQPMWLGRLYTCADALQRATDLEALRAQAQQENWPIPWIEYAYISIEVPRELGATIKLNADQLAALQNFHHALQTDQDTAQALQAVRAALPQFYGLYRALAQAFETVYSMLPLQAPTFELSTFPQQDRTNVEEALAVLTALQSWKAADHSEVLTLPEGLSHWQIIQEAQTSQHLWQEQLLPTIQAIRHREWESLELPSTSELPETFVQACAYLSKFAVQWQRIAESGLYPELTHELIFLDDQAQELFFRFWQDLEKTSSDALRWMVQMHQTLFSSINQDLLRISRHLRELARALDAVNQVGIASSRLARTSAGDIMFSLAQLAALIEPRDKPSARLQTWQEQYNQLLKQNNWQAFRQAVQELDTLHPLLPWANELVSRDIDIFTAFSQQKW